MTSDGDGGVVGPEARLVDPERPLVGRPGARQIAQVLQHGAQVVDVDRHFGVVRAQRLLGEREGSRVGGLGRVELGARLEVACRLVQEPARIFEVAGAVLGVAGRGERMGEQRARRCPGGGVIPVVGKAGAQQRDGGLEPAAQICRRESVARGGLDEAMQAQRLAA